VVDLRRDRDLVEQSWAGNQTSWLPLSVAAAFTFHQTRRDVPNLLTPNEYASALDIAAAALSCVAAICTQDELGAPVPVPINLARHRFCGGAVRVQCADGSFIAPLCIARGDVVPALVAIERTGIEYVAPKRAT
jgi:hypothetical protein